MIVIRIESKHCSSLSEPVNDLVSELVNLLVLSHFNILIIIIIIIIVIAISNFI